MQKFNKTKSVKNNTNTFCSIFEYKSKKNTKPVNNKNKTSLLHLFVIVEFNKHETFVHSISNISVTNHTIQIQLQFDGIISLFYCYSVRFDCYCWLYWHCLIIPFSISTIIYYYDFSYI